MRRKQATNRATSPRFASACFGELRASVHPNASAFVASLNASIERQRVTVQKKVTVYAPEGSIPVQERIDALSDALNAVCAMFGFALCAEVRDCQLDVYDPSHFNFFEGGLYVTLHDKTAKK